CTERLHRIVANGERKELPCWIELQAANKKEPINWSVTLMNGEKIAVQLDSATTTSEVCQAVAKKIGLKDTFGFAVYISFYEKMWSLGCCEKKHVLDAVSQCEQEMRRQGREEKDTPWSLSIRKQLFAPWHDSSQDSVSTDLIYKQVIKGVKSGEYVCEKEDEFVQLAAKHYFVCFGSQEPTRDNVREVVQECIPTTQIEQRSMTRWIQLITAELSMVKENSLDVHLHEKKKIFCHLSTGPPLPRSRFFVAVNWKNIIFMEKREKILMEISYVEVKKVEMLRDRHLSVSLSTIKGDYILRSQEAEDMAKVMEFNVDGLRKRSMYAMVQQDIPKQDDPIFLVCKRGDLLRVEKDYDDDYSQDWTSNQIKAINQRTKRDGYVNREKVEFLPTLTEPSAELLVKSPLCTKEGGRNKGGHREKLWVFSKEPIKQPLLKTLVGNSELNPLYMGDYPIKQSRSPIELTDQIFGPATKHEELRDEIYCQLMRQMTTNSSRMSLERGWQLMWLCSGLFPPSPKLKRHAQRFLESRPRDPLAAICLQRLKEPRKLPPHQAEVEAIQQNSTQMFYKIHFPNDTDALVEVSATITNRELRHRIADQLSLSSPEGYGLYTKVSQKVGLGDICVQLLPLVSPHAYHSNCGSTAQQAYVPLMVTFRRKLWFNVIPGKDLIADLTFHFPQEVPRYLRGFHQCSKEDMINLGGLLFRVAVDSDRSQFVMIPRMLGELVPSDQQKIMSPDEWKKHIITSYNGQSGMTVQEAKIAFLKEISSWPTFGCSFFEVKQTCEPSYPPVLWFTIGKKGVSLIDPRTKELQVMHPFNRIIDYNSRGNYFQMTIRTMVRGVSFVCETSQVSG
uniref:Myosin VIIBb n=1 Tax=Cyprinodon variegatus TaxID=28743 RepID=A0A3Q2DEB6_CYPVA